MAITNVKSVDNKFVMYRRQFQRIGKYFTRGQRAKLFGLTVQMLEDLRKKQITRLQAQGIAEEEITEDMLGIVITWEFLCQCSDNHFSRRAFENIVPVLIETGVVRRCYVECHRNKEGDHEDLELVTDEQGRPYTYATIDQAREQRRDGGDIVNYFYLNAKAVNDVLDKIYELRAPHQPLPPTSPPNTSHEKGPRQPSGDRSAEGRENHEREGKSGASSSCQTITHPTQNCEGIGTPKTQKSSFGVFQENTGTQNCEGGSRNSAREGSQACGGNPRKTASNKNNNKREEITEDITLNSARAIDPLSFSQFDFSQAITPEVVLQLARMIYAPLPARYRTELDKEKAYARLESAGQALANMPSAHEIGLRRLAATMAYQADESSPCSWRAECRKKYNNPGFIPRLWNLESETVLRRMNQERERVGWWPEYLPQHTGLVESPPVIDLAELAGIDQAERIGMDANTTQIVEDWLKPQLEPHGYQIIARRVGPTRARGYCIEVRFQQEDGSQRGIRFYRFDDWDLIVEADGVAPIGSLEFVRYLGEAVRQVA
jgi:hypothetical protein